MEAKFLFICPFFLLKNLIIKVFILFYMVDRDSEP